jgi:hypothetical protein
MHSRRLNLSPKTIDAPLRRSIQVDLRAALPSFGSDIQDIGELRHSENLMNRGGNIDRKEIAPTGTQFPVQKKNYADTPISSR